MTNKYSVFLALPQGSFIHPGSIHGIYRATRQQRLHIAERHSSLLTFNFNLLLAQALNEREQHQLTHFAMLHADIEPEGFWLDILIDEMDEHNADVVSAVVPLKDQSGICSCGIEDPENPYTAAFRLTLKEVYQLPETFTSADCGYPDRALLVNSGCWVMRFTEPWVEKMALESPFGMRDVIVRKENGEFSARVEPEDWRMSRWWFREGKKVMATRCAGVAHHSASETYPNFPAWGLERDPQANERLNLQFRPN